MTIVEAQPTIVRPAVPAAEPAPPAPPAADRPATRGRLTIADRVVERVAGQAAKQVDGVAGRSGGVLGLGAESDFDAAPKVDVQLNGTTATITLALGVEYPTSIRAAAQAVRTQVAEVVEQLTGVTVTRVDVDVTALTRRSAAGAENTAKLR